MPRDLAGRRLFVFGRAAPLFGGGAHDDLDLEKVGLLLLPQLGEKVEIVAVDPRAQECGRHRQPDDALGSLGQFETAEPAREHLGAEAYLQLQFDALEDLFRSRARSSSLRSPRSNHVERARRIRPALRCRYAFRSSLPHNPTALRTPDVVQQPARLFTTGRTGPTTGIGYPVTPQRPATASKRPRERLPLWRRLITNLRRSGREPVKIEPS